MRSGVSGMRSGENGESIRSKVISAASRCAWDQVLVAGHVVEMTCPTGVAEAEQVYGKRWDDELDRHFQQGMFAMDRMSADGTMGEAVFSDNQDENAATIKMRTRE